MTAFALGLEGALEGVLILALPLRVGRTLATVGFRRKLDAFPRVAAGLRAGIAGALLLVALASLSAWAWRMLAATSAFALAVEAWRARPSFGRGRRLPPGSLTLVPLGPWVDVDYYQKQAERHGPVFKMSRLTDPQVCIVDLELGRDFLRRHDTALEVPPLPFERFVPGGFIRYLAPGPHRTRAAALRTAISPQVVAAGAASVCVVMRDAMLELARRSGSLDPRDAMETAVLRGSAALFFGFEPGSAASKRLEPLMRTLDYRRARHVTTADVERALRAALAEIDASAPGGFYGALAAADHAAARDESNRVNLLYVLNTSCADMVGLMTWVAHWLATHSEWLGRLRAEAEPTALGDRIVRETLRLSQSEYLVRRTTRALDLDGFVVPKGWIVRVCIREIHRSAGGFAEPLRFSPDRFLEPPGPNAFAPFGASRLNCLGEPMTLLFGRTLALEMARYDVLVVDDGPVELGAFHWQPSSRFRVSLTPHAGAP